MKPECTFWRRRVSATAGRERTQSTIYRVTKRNWHLGEATINLITFCLAFKWKNSFSALQARTPSACTRFVCATCGKAERWGWRWNEKNEEWSAKSNITKRRPKAFAHPSNLHFNIKAPERRQNFMQRQIRKVFDLFVFGPTTKLEFSGWSTKYVKCCLMRRLQCFSMVCQNFYSRPKILILKFKDETN